MEGSKERALKYLITIVSLVALSICPFAWGSVSGHGNDVTVRELRYERSGISVTVDLPSIALRSLRHRVDVNRRLGEFARGQFNDYVHWYRESRSSKESSDGNTDLYATIRTMQWYLDPNLFSIGFTGDYYSGGAHPNGEFISFTYDVSGDTVRELGLRDLFTNDPRVDTVIANHILAIYLSEYAEPFLPIEEIRESLLENGYQAFVLQSDGIRIATWPGSHVMGPVDGIIPYDSLVAFIPNDGVVSRIIAYRNRRLRQ